MVHDITKEFHIFLDNLSYLNKPFGFLVHSAPSEQSFRCSISAPIIFVNVWFMALLSGLFLDKCIIIISVRPELKCLLFSPTHLCKCMVHGITKWAHKFPETLFI